MTLGPQLWIGKTEPRPELFEPAHNDRHHVHANKPGGGLWTSSYLGEHGSGWVQWCLCEDFAVPVTGLWQAWLLIPRRDSSVLVINGEAALVNATRRYGWSPYPYMPDDQKLDFEAIARDYDAVHLTEEGQWETRLSFPLNMYGWDCESTAWLRWSFDHVEYLGERKFVIRPEEDEEVA